jgi:hypothetical protein
VVAEQKALAGITAWHVASDTPVTGFDGTWRRVVRRLYIRPKVARNGVARLTG